MTAQHVFSVEKHDEKRKFLMSAHCPPGEPVQFHMYSDVACFADGKAYCHTCEREHPVKHTLDMILSGPSCKNLSKENSKRMQFLECYSDGSGSSGETYQLGFKEAIKQTSPTVGLFENTVGVAECPKDPKDKTKKLPAPVEIVTEDMSELGYVFEYQRVDSQKYLVRQRRNRVWGSANLRNSATQDEYHVAMKTTMDMLASEHHFDFSKCFEEGLPIGIPANKGFELNLVNALQRAELIGQDPSDLFLDCSTSKSRSERPEMAFGVSTCVRPTHKIYTHKYRRCLTPKEHWRCQGLFEGDFAAPDAVKEVLNQITLARDLAGRDRNIYIYTYTVYIYIYISLLSLYIYIFIEHYINI